MNTVQTSRPGDVQLVPLTPKLAYETRVAAAADRGHRLIAPTHAVVKVFPDGHQRVIGYGSLGRVRLFFAWMDTQHASPRDSFTAWRLAEAEMQQMAANTSSPLQPTHENLICMPCEAASPFAPYLERRGYETLGTALVTLKNLKE